MRRVQIGSFRLVRELGCGGMGCVYSATHLQTNTRVACKVMTLDIARSKRYRQSFRREVHTMAYLNHAAIVMPLDAGEVGAHDAAHADGLLVEGSPYQAMEYIDCLPFWRIVQDLTWKRLERIILSVLDALAHAHALDVLHRDIKPGNLLISADDQGSWAGKLTDFGISRPVFLEPSGGLWPRAVWAYPPSSVGPIA